jgi:ribosomal protein S18 acetylase RimI-like enzyme
MTPETITIRRAAEPDAPALRSLRLKALQEHPEAFLISVAEEAENMTGDFAALIGGRWAADDNQMLVADYDGKLVGMCGFYREERDKLAHRCTIWGLYVHPDARSHHVGRRLLEDALDRAKLLSGVTQIHISVTADNQEARRLYESVGFTAWGVEPGSMQVNGRVLDEAHMVMLLGSDDRDLSGHI